LPPTMLGVGSSAKEKWAKKEEKEEQDMPVKE
jgi:hypothetical protein